MFPLLNVFKEKEAKRFKLKAGVFLLLIEDNKILLSRRYQTGIDDGLYFLPAGGHDGLESLTQAMIREAKEETNIELSPGDLEMCHVTHRLHQMPEGLSFEQLDFFFRARTYRGTIQNKEPSKCDDLSFFPLDHLPTNIIPHIAHTIEAIQKGLFYSEFGFERNVP